MRRFININCERRWLGWMDDGDGDEEGVEDETENDDNSEVKGKYC